MVRSAAHDSLVAHLSACAYDPPRRVQVGQCGNQIGCRFWDLALREHAMANKKGV